MITSTRHIDFIGLGAPKCGSSKLSTILAAHPDICLAEPKGIRYFNETEAYYKNIKNPHRQFDLEWYANHFKHHRKESIIGEYSTEYLYCPKAAQHIFKAFPKVKMFASIRHPAERAFSHYLWNKYFLKVEKRSFNILIREEKELIEKGLYAKQLQRYFDNFDAKQIKVIELASIKKDIDQVAKSVYQFLEVDANFKPENLNEKVNAARATRSVMLSKIYATAVKKLIDSGNAGLVNTIRKSGLKKIYNKINQGKIDAKETMDKTDFLFIMEHSRNDIEALGKMLNKDFTSWFNFEN